MAIQAWTLEEVMREYGHIFKSEIVAMNFMTAANQMIDIDGVYTEKAKSIRAKEIYLERLIKDNYGTGATTFKGPQLRKLTKAQIEILNRTMIGDEVKSTSASTSAVLTVLVWRGLFEKIASRTYRRIK